MQELVIEGWHPANFQVGPQASAGAGWRRIRERKESFAKVREAAEAAGWVPVKGKALIEAIYVYTANYRTDVDNLAHRLKGVLDGVKTVSKGPEARHQTGWIEDDDTEHLDLRIRKVTEKGRKALVLRLYGVPVTHINNEETEWSAASTSMQSEPCLDSSAQNPIEPSAPSTKPRSKKTISRGARSGQRLPSSPSLPRNPRTHSLVTASGWGPSRRRRTSASARVPTDG